MAINTSKDVERHEPAAPRKSNFWTYEEALVQVKHGFAIRRASWPLDQHLVDGKIVGALAPIADDDEDHDPADSNPDETRKAVRAAAIASGKAPAKARKEASKAPEVKLEKEDKEADDWTIWVPKDARVS